ncbi:MAG: ABC transporter permease [Candidatus Binatus sp.]|uniref:ABC transporter permease n=1 Tax=Candidatus Binatus sp. TaxID=2811406 RepID=UPI00271F2CCA|nr:ABC transporter permease [Candidatus Binatus sp.]MDO8434855.1 ABC transporter permease [Candidatus Binatus sp.]
MKYAVLILKNLFRSKRRTILTVLSIAVSLFIFSALVSIPTVANQILGATAASTRIATHNRAGMAYSIPVAYRQRILAIPHVEAAITQSWFGGVYHELYDQFPNFAVDHDQIEKVYTDWGLTPEAIEQFKKIRTACVVGADTMKRFHLHVGQQIQLKGSIYNFNLTLQIVGVLGGKAPPSFLIFRRDYLEEAAGRPGFVSLIWVKADKSEHVPQVIAAIDEGFANSSAETLSESESAFIGNFMQTYRTFFRMAEILGFIVVLTIGLVAANTAAMSIRERRGEIAVMRSIGFTSRTILSLLLSESLIIGLLGGLLGCGSAFIVLKLFAIGTGGVGPLSSIRMPPLVLGETLIASALIGVFSALGPAMSAARRNIVDALRTVA